MTTNLASPHFLEIIMAKMTNKVFFLALLWLALTALSFFAAVGIMQVIGNPRLTISDLLDAMEKVEDRNNEVYGDLDEVGPLQIRRIYVDDVNLILGKDIYAHKDRRSRLQSRVMASVYMHHYAPNNTFEEMARIHNGGPTGHLKESTKAYWEKVKGELK